MPRPPPRSIRSRCSASTAVSPSSPARRPGSATASPACCTPSARRSCSSPGAPSAWPRSPSSCPASVVVAADLSIADDRERAVATTLERCGRVDVLVNNAGRRRHRRRRGRDARPLPRRDGAERHGAVAPVEARRAVDARARQRQHRQHRVDARPRRLDAGQAGALLRVEGRGDQPHPRAGAAVGAQGRPRQRAVPRVVPERDDRRAWRPTTASQQFIKTMSPMPRMGFEHELDGALLLLASDASTFMTGQSVIVDGGLDRPLTRRR